MIGVVVGGVEGVVVIGLCAQCFKLNFCFAPHCSQVLRAARPLFGNLTAYTMIRRNPTLIPLGDFDVQDARDMLAKQKADAAQQQQFVLKMKRIAENPRMDREDFEVMEQLKVAAARQEKAKRLGLQPGEYSLRSSEMLMPRLFIESMQS